MFRISQCGIPNAALVYGDDSSVHEMHPGSLSTDLDVVDSRKTVRLRPKADAAHSLEELTRALRRGKPCHVLSNERGPTLTSMRAYGCHPLSSHIPGQSRAARGTWRALPVINRAPQRLARTPRGHSTKNPCPMRAKCRGAVPLVLMHPAVNPVFCMSLAGKHAVAARAERRDPARTTRCRVRSHHFLSIKRGQRKS